MWLKSPMSEVKPATVPLLRPKAGGSISAVITGGPLRCFVHYCSGRSWPCTDHKCTLCKRGITRRFYAYYPCRGVTNNAGILELTAQTDAALISQMEPVTQIPKGQIKISRAGGKRNNPCQIIWREEEGPEYRGDASLNERELMEALMRIWNLPARNGEIEESEYLEKLNEAIRLKTTPTSKHS